MLSNKPDTRVILIHTSQEVEFMFALHSGEEIVPFLVVLAGLQDVREALLVVFLLRKSSLELFIGTLFVLNGLSIFKRST